MSLTTVLADWRMRDRNSLSWTGTLGAAAITIAALALCWLLRPLLQEGIFAIALASTTLCALLFGFWPAVVATILTAIELVDLFSLPAFHWTIPSPTDTLQLVAYLVSAGLIIAIAKARQEARQRQEETNAKLRSAIASRDRLLAVVSHDLKSPLSAIQLSVDLLQSPAGQDCTIAERIGSTIQASVQRMDSLIRDLLDLSVIEQGIVALNRRPRFLADVLDQTLTLMQPLARDKGVTLGCHIPDGLPLVPVDSHRLRQVQANLIGNAIKFTPTGGSVQVEVQSPADNEVRVCVRDTGPGIAEEALPHLFDRTWMARHVSPQGTGLGLSIARTIVEAHGGRIWARNNADVGASFCYTLPTVERPAQTREAA